MTHMNYKAIGNFGFARIGQLVAERLSPFNVTIQQYDSINKKGNENFKFVDFETFVSTSYAITIHAAHTSDTDTLFNKVKLK